MGNYGAVQDVERGLNPREHILGLVLQAGVWEKGLVPLPPHAGASRTSAGITRIQRKPCVKIMELGTAGMGWPFI